MTTSFESLKRNSKSSLNDLAEKLNNFSNKTQRAEDNRFWEPTVDKAKNGYAVIRFLPSPPNEDMPFVRIWDHGFQGPSGKWYIEKSLTTIGAQDPVAEYNSKLWNVSDDDSSPTREQARKQKRRLHFISNILVIKDPGNPENEGKVFLYKYGKKIFNMINNLMSPPFEDDIPINPFDLWEGANFRLKIRDVEGYRNYDLSAFANPGPISDNDDELKKIWESEHSLKAFLEPSNFKSYDELKLKLQQVLNLTGSDFNNGTKSAENDFIPESEIPKFKTAPSKAEESDDVPWTTEEDDDDSSYFEKLKRLAEDD